VERYKIWRLRGTDQIAACKPVTVKHDLDNLSVFFGWAVKFNYSRANPVKDVTRPSDADAVRQHVISAEEERRYFSIAKGNVRDLARLILLQGMRPEEVCGLAKSDVDLTRGTVTVRFGKTDAATRTLRLTEESKLILGPRLNTLGPWIFPNPKNADNHIVKLNRAHDLVCEKTGLAVVLYDFRHTFATRLAEAGVDAFAIAAILGHSSNGVLNRYIHPTQEHQDSAMKIYDQLYGRLGKSEQVN
jgi:integrase